jgi:hypothetical protein
MKIKLKKLHGDSAHVWGGIGHYHDSSKSLYGYKQYRIKTDHAYMGWYVATEDGKQISPIYLDMSFKEAKEWLENYLDEIETKEKQHA